MHWLRLQLLLLYCKLLNKTRVQHRHMSMKASHVKKLQQEVHGFLSELHFDIIENVILRFTHEDTTHLVGHLLLILEGHEG